MTEDQAAEFRDAMVKAGLTSPAGYLIFSYTRLLAPQSLGEAFLIDGETADELSHLAERALKNTVLSPEEREYLENIVDRKYPEPFRCESVTRF